ncbi:aspartyl aminopeptidase-like [Lingula anatina]|uniref:aspartyl aminopeptidase n=1 Tax=Lingula anatina TaxID=7574 RepID=A0A1S3K8S3_LINAN|nr:aspartyl aminopeptidase-like [Lingula anatina]|eukprot:XP_013418902.1 aspartyl aminopeptidase-like [Lingula anatina]
MGKYSRGSAIFDPWSTFSVICVGLVDYAPACYVFQNDSKLGHRLVHVKRPILRVPNIAIHLMRDMNEKFSPNKETHLQPILATSVQEELEYGSKTAETSDFKQEADKHHPVLVHILSGELGMTADQIMDFELCLADTQPACLGGALNEFIFAPRLDNLLNAYTAMEGLLDACNNETLQQDPNIRMISLFDNEEVGSQSAQGAGSTFQELVLRRISGPTPGSFEIAMPRSLMVSADQAHAVHPNYSEKHEDQHRPGLHKGIVVKHNANQRYATTAVTAAILREVATRSHVPLQDFVVRNDSPCGSTIGPIMSAKLGMPTVDIGGPQLSMHSIREMCCTSSVLQSIKLYKGFFEFFPEIYASSNL